MQLSHVASVVGVFGPQGSGKTRLALTLLVNQPAKVRFLFDYEGEFSARLNLPACSTPEEMAAALETGWVCYNPHVMFPPKPKARKSDPSQNQLAFEFFCRFVFKYSEAMDGKKIVVVDELQYHITPHCVPESLRDIVQRGRRRGINCIFISQQPNGIHNLIQEQLTEVFCFQLVTDNSMAFIREFRFDPEEIFKLGLHEWICRDKRGNVSRSGAVKT